MQEYSVTILLSDDWEGMYVDGLLFEEGHKLSNQDFIDLIRKHNYFSHIEQKWVSSDILEELGGEFPYRLSDIPVEMFE